MLTQKELKELLHYDPDTGVFVWKPRDIKHFTGRRTQRMWNANYQGKQVGCLDGLGYIMTGIHNKNYRLHRLAWLYMYGEFPPHSTDHINHVSSDNRISNIRAVDEKENPKNSSISKANTSGFVGVRWHKKNKKWEAMINVDKAQKYLGCFVNLSDAVKIRVAAEKKYGFHVNHGLR